MLSAGKALKASVPFVVNEELIHAAPVQLPGATGTRAWATPSLLLVRIHPQFGKEFLLVP